MVLKSNFYWTFLNFPDIFMNLPDALQDYLFDPHHRPGKKIHYSYLFLSLGKCQRKISRYTSLSPKLKPPRTEGGKLCWWSMKRGWEPLCWVWTSLLDLESGGCGRWCPFIRKWLCHPGDSGDRCLSWIKSPGGLFLLYGWGGKVPQTRWLQTTRVYCMVLEVRSPKKGVSAGLHAFEGSRERILSLAFSSF